MAVTVWRTRMGRENGVVGHDLGCGLFGHMRLEHFQSLQGLGTPGFRHSRVNRTIGVWAIFGMFLLYLQIKSRDSQVFSESAGFSEIFSFFEPMRDDYDLMAALRCGNCGDLQPYTEVAISLSRSDVLLAMNPFGV